MVMHHGSALVGVGAVVSQEIQRRIASGYTDPCPELAKDPETEIHHGWEEQTTSNSASTGPVGDGLVLSCKGLSPDSPMAPRRPAQEATPCARSPAFAWGPTKQGSAPPMS